jgi:CubicO group peptidase (beta-lactamase class C family)
MTGAWRYRMVLRCALAVMVRHLKPHRARQQQSAGRRGLRRSLLGLAGLLMILGIVALALYTWAWRSTDRSTIARALIWREADVGDQHRFPSRPIPAGRPTSALPAGPAVDLRVPAPDRDNGPARLDDLLVGTDTRAFLVVHGGRVVYERYAGDSGPRTLETSFSVAKSFVSTLVGIAIDEGRIGSVEDPVTRYVPELAARDRRFEQITLRNLLTMSSGLRYEESSFPSPRGDDTSTYYGVDLRKDALERTEIEQAPGKSWHYNNYNPLLLGLVLERATGMSVSDYMASRLWQPLGAGSDASWSLDSERSGFEKMESGLNATALDNARFGLLLLHGGEWNRRRIVSREWVRSATRAQTATDFPNPYGFFWWIDGRRPSRFYALGNYGQYIYVDPQADVVVVRLGSDWGFGNEAWLATFRAIADHLSA